MGGNTSKRALLAPNARKKTVVIIGGNVGSWAAKVLAEDFNVVLIDRKDFYEAVPCTVEVLLAPDKFEKYAATPHATLHPNAKFVHGSGRIASPGKVEVTGVAALVDYDYLVVAIGRPYTLFKGGFAPDGDIAATMHGRKAQWVAASQRIKEASHIVLGGGGSVAVELAAEILEYYPQKKVTIVSSTPTLLAQEPVAAQAFALDWMQNNGYTNAKVVFGDKVEVVEAVSGDWYRLAKAQTRIGDEGEAVFYVPCFPTSHSKGGGSTVLPAACYDAHGRVMVDEFHRIKGLLGNDHPSVAFAIGDATDDVARHTEYELSAIGNKEGIHVADQIYRHANSQELVAAEPSKVPSVITLGSKTVVGHIKKPNGEVQVVFAGGLLGRIVIWVKLHVHHTGLGKLANVDKNSNY